MSFRYSIVSMAFLSSIVFALALPAQETGHTDQGEAHATEETTEHAEASEHDPHGGDREWIQNEFAVFLGATSEDGHPTEFTWGLEYVREVAHRWGVGVLYDYAGGSVRNAVIGVPVSYNPVGRLKLMAAPCVEYHNGRGGSGGSHKAEAHGESDESDTFFLIRLSVGYDFIIAPRYSLVPRVSLDFVNHERVWVYGVNFTHKF